MDIGKHSHHHTNPSSNSFNMPSHRVNSLGISALVLDDNIANNMIISKSLYKLGVDCRTFMLSELAFEDLDASEPDILFIDYNMPDINGIDFVRELRSSNLIRDSKLVCITADLTISTRTKLDDHFDHVLYKPVRQNELQDIIRALKVSLETNSHLLELAKSN